MMQGLLLSAAVLLGSGAIPAKGLGATIDVRHPEGTTHAYLALLAVNGDSIAQGELLQTIKADRVDSRLVFKFKDGSVHDERTVFSQQGVFTLLHYRLTQRGPSFPDPLDVSMGRATGKYTVRTRSGKDGSEQILAGRLTFPTDVYNGMLILLLKNLAPGEIKTVQIVAFTPKPKIVPIKLAPVRKKTVKVGVVSKQATQYAMRPQLAGMTRFFGRLLGMLPADDHYYCWILNGEVSSFVQFEGPLFLTGPIWRIELLNPQLSLQVNGKIFSSN
ncbi:MAG TPA: hypothetical protein VGQ60_05015 [Nitrospiraceae bacterium]|nr:hypothetical protein [Nitrospiraceae bacterium]